jgi:tRNA(Ile)-lysidine synthase
MSARFLRHQFLANTAREAGMRSVALAHHADDQVELFFLRLFRGGGGQALAGMKWKAPSPADRSVQLIRPLLNFSKAELLDFAKAKCLQFNLDASNDSVDIFRNRIRKELLPLMRRRYQWALNEVVLRTMEIAGGEAEVVNATAAEWLDHFRRTTRSRRKHAAATRYVAFHSLPVAVQRSVLRLQLVDLGVAYDYAMLEYLRLNPDKKLTVLPGLEIFRAEDGLLTAAREPGKFRSGTDRLILEGTAGAHQFGGVRLKWKKMRGRSKEAVPRRIRGREYFDAEQIGREVIVRHWQPGDRYQPIGATCQIKLQDFFVNQGVPRETRRQLLCATTVAGEIFWIEGMRISERFKLTPETRLRLEWCWQRANEAA